MRTGQPGSGSGLFCHLTLPNLRPVLANGTHLYLMLRFQSHFRHRLHSPAPLKMGLIHVRHHSSYSGITKETPIWVCGRTGPSLPGAVPPWTPGSQ